MDTEQQATTSQAEETGQAQEATENTEAQEQRAEEKPDATVEARAEATRIEDLPKWARDQIRALRKENADRRTAQKERDDAEKTQLQQASERASTLEEENDRLRRQVRRSAFIETVNLPNARAAWGYVLDGTVEVEYDENDRPTNMDAVRKRLREEDGALFGNGSADGGTRTVQGGYEGPAGLGRLTHAYSSQT